ncbi:MAG: endonuclease/exonuclease/phosphatase family protein, partial [Flavobacteriales bacterium]|nr:endonuclease/exonuclease/phosphatase family protein [Flavobacteriales bacterium]
MKIRSLITAILLCCLIPDASAQVRVMSYNLLNFPTGNLQGRIDTLQNIMDYYRPHLLLIQELKTEDGLADITDMLDDLDYGSFAHGTFVPQQSNGGTTNPLQQNVVYDTQVFTLTDEFVIETDVRDINGFKFYFNDPSLTSEGDTTFLYAFSAHLKSSQGAAEEAARLAMVEAWIDWTADELSTDDLVLFAGDFNLYTSDEPAYQALTDSSNPVVLQDVFADYGDWSVPGFDHLEILTQSTRISAIYDDGAGGGIDDRFDFILMSEGLYDENSPVQYLDGSYQSLGNNGTCYNNSIILCADDNEVPADVLQSIYYMSDHIPQVLSMQIPTMNGVAESSGINMIEVQ